MITKIKNYKELPFEVNKTYRTKLQTGEQFTVTRDVYKRNKDGLILGISDTIWGIWEKHPHLGECPIAKERLIPDKEYIGDVEVCSKCNTPINK